MTSQGRPYARFRRALATGNPLLVTAAAAELRQVSLADSLAVCLVYRDADPERFDRAIVRWHARLAQQARAMGPRESQLALAALQALRGPAAAPVARLLAELCGAARRFVRKTAVSAVSGAPHPNRVRAKRQLASGSLFHKAHRSTAVERSVRPHKRYVSEPL